MRKEDGGVEISSQKKYTFMNIIKALSAGLFAVSVCIAYEVNISGKVTNTSGVTPIAGAVVKLEYGGLTATSDADGSFTLSGATAINDQINDSKPHTLSATINNGFIHFNIAERSEVNINTYTLQGKTVSSIIKTLGFGAHSIRLPRLGAGVYVYSVQSGGERLLIKSYSIGDVSGGRGVSIQSSTPLTLAGHSMSYDSISDVIAVTKAGYLNYRVIVTNSDTSGIEIKMIVCADTMVDIDGNVYQTVQIGNQVWTVENLKTTKYNDGTAIPHITFGADWVNDTLGAYCYYNNTIDSGEQEKWGAIYNWYAVNTGKLAIEGWHVPTDAEWDTLQNYLIANGYNWDGTTTGNKIGKSMAAKTDWTSISIKGEVGNNISTNNSSGFSALPSGVRGDGGGFYLQGGNGFWWSATEYDASNSYIRELYYGYNYLWRYNFSKALGFHVRLLRN